MILKWFFAIYSKVLTFHGFSSFFPKTLLTFLGDWFQTRAKKTSLHPISRGQLQITVTKKLHWTWWLPKSRSQTSSYEPSVDSIHWSYRSRSPKMLIINSIIGLVCQLKLIVSNLFSCYIIMLYSTCHQICDLSSSSSSSNLTETQVALYSGRPMAARTLAFISSCAQTSRLAAGRWFIYVHFSVDMFFLKLILKPCHRQLWQKQPPHPLPSASMKRLLAVFCLSWFLRIGRQFWNEQKASWNHPIPQAEWLIPSESAWDLVSSKSVQLNKYPDNSESQLVFCWFCFIFGDMGPGLSNSWAFELSDTRNRSWTWRSWVRHSARDALGTAYASSTAWQPQLQLQQHEQQEFHWLLLP